MSILRVAVADSNQEYLNRLTAVLTDYSDLKISQFDDRASLIKAVSNGKCQVLLLDPSMYDLSLMLDKVQVTVLLTGENRVPADCEGLQRIRKFQRIDCIYQQLMEICSMVMDDYGNDERSGSATVITFYSPIGGCGKTSTALIAASKMATLGQRVFYLNLEPFPSDGCYLPQKGGHSLSALLEHLTQRGDHTMYMQSCLLTKTDNFSYIRHFDNPNDYGAMSSEELENLITILYRSGNFDVVIVDTGSEFDKTIQHMFTLSDQIVLIEKNDPMGIAKMESFLSQAYIIEEFGDKMKRVLNFDNGRGSALNTAIPLIGRISALVNSDSNSLIMSKSNSLEAGFVLMLAD